MPLDTSKGVPTFVGFLTYLRRQQGFEHIGIDHYVRVDALLDKLDHKYLFTDLRALLRPICTNSKDQQKQFDIALDDYLRILVPPSKDDAKKEVPPSLTGEISTGESNPHVRRRWLTRSSVLQTLAGMLLMVLIIWLSKSIFRQNQKRRAETASSSTTASNTTQPSNQNPVKGGVTSNPNGNSSNVNEGGITSNEGNSNLGACNCPANSSPETPSDVRQKLTEQSSSSTVSLIFPFIITGGGLLIFAANESYRFFRRQQILRKQLSKKLPYVWPIQAELPRLRLFDTEEYNRAIRSMRRRQVDEFYHLDVPSTISATLGNFGYPSFRYRVATRSPEYLILIDRTSFLDHQAQMAFELASAFKRAGLFVATYFFEDPHLCCDATGKCVRLFDLQTKYAGHRLFVFSDGSKYLNPLTGELASWSKLLQSWPERALLTSTPPSQWGCRELTLAERFIVWPSAVKSLAVLIDHFEAAERPGVMSWQRRAVDSPPERLDHPDAIETLRSYLGEKLFRWLCACAVYPELQWRLTLYLGSLLSTDENLLTEDNLWRLIRLPWFRVGSIPDTIRESLIEELGPEDEKTIRSVIIALMKKAPPGKDLHGTVGEAAYNMNLSVQRWLRDRDRKSYRDVVQNKDVVQHLLSSSTPLSQIRAVRSWREQLFKDGIPALGLKTGLRLLTALLAIAIACGIAYWVASPDQGNDAGNRNTSNANANTTTNNNTNSPNTNNANNTNIPNGNVSSTNVNNVNGGNTGNPGNGTPVGPGRNINSPQDNSRPVSPPSGANLFDQFSNLRYDDAKARLDNFAVMLQQEPTARGEIFYSEGLSKESEGGRLSKEEARAKAMLYMDYLINTRGIDPSRLVVNYGGRNIQSNFSLYVVSQNNKNILAK